MEKVLIKNVVIWAIVVILASYLYKDTEDDTSLFRALVVGAALINAVIYNALKKKDNSSIGSYQNTT